MQVHFPEIPKSRDVAYDVFIYIKAFCEIVWWNRSMCTPRGVEEEEWRGREGGEGEEDEEEEEEDKGSGRGNGKSLNAFSFYS